MLKDESDGFTILIKGHTDEIGTFEYNQNLCMDRAKSVKKMLVIRGIEPEIIKTISFGESQPIKVGLELDIRRKNRRAIIEIVPAEKDPSQTTISMNQ